MSLVPAPQLFQLSDKCEDKTLFLWLKFLKLCHGLFGRYILHFCLPIITQILNRNLECLGQPQRTLYRRRSLSNFPTGYTGGIHSAQARKLFLVEAKPFPKVSNPFWSYLSHNSVPLMSAILAREPQNIHDSGSL